MLNVLYEDGPCLAVNKPTGLVTQGPAEAYDSLSRQTRAYLKETYAKPGNVYLGIPHRLDRAVSGVVLFAKNSKAARRLAEQFRDRQVKKVYWAVVEGRVDPPQGTLINWLDKVPNEPRAQVLPGVTPTAREATLHYRTLASFTHGANKTPRTLLEIELGTGRFHQIRIQLSHQGWPIVDDRLYQSASGSPHATSSKDGTDEFAPISPEEEAIALHARKLTFFHPIRFDLVTVQAPLPASWQLYGLPGELALD